MNRIESQELSDQQATNDPVYYRGEAPQRYTEDTGLGTASLVLGIVSILSGWLLIGPIVGFVLGVKSRRREPMAQTQAKWGIILNGVCLAIWLIIVLFLLGAVVFGGWMAVINQ